MPNTVVITGANRGIGLALTKKFVQEKFEVIAVCRTSSPELLSENAEVIDGIDLCHTNAIRELARKLAPYSIDILINNAGIWGNETLGSINYQQMGHVIQNNAIAPMQLTETLLPLMSQNSKIAFITSRMGSIEDNTSGGSYDYRMSKAALNIAAKSLSIDVKPQDISVAILHPGFVQTDMVGGRGHITADEAAERLFQRINQLNLSNSGTFWHSDGSILPW